MALKAKIRSLFPALVQVQTPLTLVKQGLSYTFGIDPSKGALGPAGPGYGGTSTSSLAIGTGSKTFSTQSGYAYAPGNYIRASSAADGTNYMEGTITSYADNGGGAGTIVLNVTKTGGSGTKSDWVFSIAGTPGANGAGSGDMLAANNLSDVGNKKTSKDNISIHGANVASAATIDLESATGDLIDVTGTTTITAITLNDGHERTVRFTGALTLTNGASLVLPGGANITTAAGDFAVFRGYAAGVVRCVGYTLANGRALVAPSGMVTGSGSPTVGDLAAFSNTSASAIAGTGYSAQQVPGLIPKSATVTISNASPAVVTWVGHGLPALAPLYFETTGSLPTGLTAAVKSTGTQISPNTYQSDPTLYYLIPVDADHFQLATSLANARAGTAVNTSSAGSGTHTAFANAAAPAGTVGELKYKVVEIGSGVNMPTATEVTWVTLDLTPGIWEVGGIYGLYGNTGSPTFSDWHATIGYSVSGGFLTITSPYGGINAAHITTNQSNGIVMPFGTQQIVLTGNTTISSAAKINFTGGGSAVSYGVIWARRIK
jgi:hypothetical protein